MSKRSVIKPAEETFTCIKCEKPKKKADFYKSYHPDHKDGIIPYCKECARKMCSDEKGRVVKEKLANFLKNENVNKPFIEEIWDYSVADKRETLGVYMRNLALTKYKDMGWSEGETNAYTGGLTVDDLGMPYSNEDFQVTVEMMNLFGMGYTEAEYRVMQSKYDTLSPFYEMHNPFYKEALLNYIRAKAKEEVALTENRFTDVKFWGGIATQAAKDAGINPSQLKEQDTDKNLTCFSKIYEEVEKSVDVVRILPEFKHAPKDSADFILFLFALYVRDLQGKEPCEYKDIYKFYDDAVANYIKRYGDEYGLFSDNPTTKNRDNIQEFLDECQEVINGEP